MMINSCKTKVVKGKTQNHFDIEVSEKLSSRFKIFNPFYATGFFSISSENIKEAIGKLKELWDIPKSSGIPKGETRMFKFQYNRQ